MSPEVLLVVRDLVTQFGVSAGVFRRTRSVVHALDGVSFSLDAGTTLGLVGESGCGKSTLAYTLLRLVEASSGSVVFDGTEVTTANPRELKHVRGQMQIVFQNPFGSLNPRLTIGANVAEPLRIHRVPSSQRQIQVRELLAEVGLRPEFAHRYPVEFSGGQLQRVGIARSLAVRPRLLVLDEPVSSLDVSVQAQVINLLERLQADLGLAYLFISHDLSVVRHLSRDIAVMYLGKIVEIGPRDMVCGAAAHPYTVALLSAVPVQDPTRRSRGRRRVLQGDLPSPLAPPSGCRFRTRCWKAQILCAEVEPPLLRASDSSAHLVACHFPERFSGDGIGISSPPADRSMGERFSPPPGAA